MALVALLTPVKAAFAVWMKSFYDQFQPDTQQNQEWAARGFATACVWAPGRMVDQVEKMLSTWARNDNSTAGNSQTGFLPVLFMAAAHEWIETPGEGGRPVVDPMAFSFDDDGERRSFRLRLMSVDLRVQVAVVSHEPNSPMSMIGQLALYLNRNETLKAAYSFGGFTSHWPAKIIMIDRMAIPVPTGEQRTILTLDLTLRATIPLFEGPRQGEPTDGRTPPGFPVVTEVTSGHNMTMGPPSHVTEEEWRHYAALMQWSKNIPPTAVLSPIAER
jgi:hypothetical protein